VDVLDQLIQDDGLIFASGKRDNLTDDHGKIYCVHQLLLSYLRKGQIQGAVMTIPSTKSEGIHNPESSPSESTQGTPKKYDF
jgi:hypothetical protein